MRNSLLEGADDPLPKPEELGNSHPYGTTEDFVPVTNYVRATDDETFVADQATWLGRSYTSFFRLAWRSMVPFNTSRSLQAALIPPGPAHVHTVQSMAFEESRLTALNAGFWATLPWTTY
ncbi:hypothetical protein GCM10023238_11480 [Streptomyces heliomycini]